MDSKSAVCTAKHGKYTKHTRHIAKTLYLVRIRGKQKMHNIDWCEGGLKLADIDTDNIGENDLNPRMKYIMVILDNWDKKLVQEGWHNKW